MPKSSDRRIRTSSGWSPDRRMSKGAGTISLRDLVRQALRMRPDRIVVGEVRGAEVVDLLAALNTGHDGGAGTVHANTAADVPARLEALAGLGGIGREALHAQLAGAVRVVLHVRRGGRQRVLQEIAVLERGPDGIVVAVRRWCSAAGVSRAHRVLAGLLADHGQRDSVVICLLLAVAALLWPLRVRLGGSGSAPGWLGGADRGDVAGTSSGSWRLRAGRSCRQLRRSRLPGALAGAAGCAGHRRGPRNGHAVGSAALSERRRRTALVDIVAGLRMLGRELRAGAEPAVAARNAGSAARGAGAEVLAGVAQLARVDSARPSGSSAATRVTHGCRP